VPVGSAQPDSGHLDQQLALSGACVGLFVQAKVADAVETERLYPCRPACTGSSREAAARRIASPVSASK
jgi:hypothetical protein